MSAYKFRDPDGLYFVTLTVVEWIDVFTRKDYVDQILESLRFCQQRKGLIVHAWCIMSNHIHLIISRTEGGDSLSNILRDFKKYTSSQIVKTIENSARESRKNWILWIFKAAGKKNSNNSRFQFWLQDNHAIQLETNRFIDQKLDYLHRNPVVAGFVDEPEHWNYSSAKDYSGRKGLLEVAIIT